MTRSILVAKGTNPRKVVLARLEELGWSRYRLQKSIGVRQIPKSTLYAWLSGKVALPDEKLEPVFTVLGLTVQNE